MKAFHPIVLSVALASISCAQGDAGDDTLSPDIRRLSDSASTCLRTVCSQDFAENDACQEAWKAQRNVEARSRADTVAYYQARVSVDRAYQMALERRLGQSAYSHSTCGIPTKPLGPL